MCLLNIVEVCHPSEHEKTHSRHAPQPNIPNFISKPHSSQNRHFKNITIVFFLRVDFEVDSQCSHKKTLVIICYKSIRSWGEDIQEIYHLHSFCYRAWKKKTPTIHTPRRRRNTRQGRRDLLPWDGHWKLRIPREWPWFRYARSRHRREKSWNKVPVAWGYMSNPRWRLSATRRPRLPRASPPPVLSACPKRHCSAPESPRLPNLLLR